MQRSKRVTYVTLRTPTGRPVVMSTRRDPYEGFLAAGVGILGAAVAAVFIVGLVVIA